MNLNELTAHELTGLLKEGKTTSREIHRSVMNRIREKDKDVNAYVRVFDEQPDESAAGIPIGIKDNICINGKEVTCASKILRGFRPPYDATVIQKLKKFGAVFIGHTNMDEFAFGS